MVGRKSEGVQESEGEPAYAPPICPCVGSLVRLRTAGVPVHWIACLLLDPLVRPSAYPLVHPCLCSPACTPALPLARPLVCCFLFVCSPIHARTRLPLAHEAIRLTTDSFVCFLTCSLACLCIYPPSHLGLSFHLPARPHVIPVEPAVVVQLHGQSWTICAWACNQ